MSLAEGLVSEKGRAIHLEGEQTDAAVDYTQAEEKKLIRKIDLFLLPTIWLMYLLSYVDRTKYGFDFVSSIHFFEKANSANIDLRGWQHRQRQNRWFAEGSSLELRSILDLSYCLLHYLCRLRST